MWRVTTPSSSVHLSRSVSLITEVFARLSRRTSLIPLQWFIPHLVHSEWSHVASVVTRSVWFVVVGASGHGRLVREASHVRWWTISELSLSEGHRGRWVASESGHWTSVFGWWVVIREAIRIRSVHHFAVTTCSRLLEIRVEVLGVLRTLVEASVVVLAIPMVVVSGRRPSLVVLILRRWSSVVR